MTDYSFVKQNGRITAVRKAPAAAGANQGGTLPVSRSFSEPDALDRAEYHRLFFEAASAAQRLALFVEAMDRKYGTGGPEGRSHNEWLIPARRR